MSSPFLDSYIKNASFALTRQIRLLETNSLEPRRGIHAMCTMFRQRAVCTLLRTGQTDVFYANMMQSAAAFLHYLDQVEAEEKVTSFAKPFFDAIAGSYWDAAGEIAAKSRPTWNTDFEYEDDFLYVYFLMQYFFLEGSDEVLDELLARYAEVLGRALDVRLGLCRALRHRDSQRFHESLVMLLEERSAQVEELAARNALIDEQLAWVRHFSLEGVALLKLVDRAGLTTDVNYLHIPELVRGAGPFVFARDAWRVLDFKPPRRSSSA